MKPNPRNACAGAYDGWMEVHLLPECNGKCAWCVEKQGWRAKHRASVDEMVKAIRDSGVESVVLLGGEPTLYPGLEELLAKLPRDLNIAMTTNGSMLTMYTVYKVNLSRLNTLNVSLHDVGTKASGKVTGVAVDETKLRRALACIPSTRVRFNCTCLAGHVDSWEKMQRYVVWAGSIGATGVRFSELKGHEDQFVSLLDCVPHLKHIKDPFVDGCSEEIVMEDMRVGFRVMCGMNTTMRPRPEDPEQVPHGVLYYDGVIYAGWQCGGTPPGTERRRMIMAKPKAKLVSTSGIPEVDEAVLEGDPAKALKAYRRWVKSTPHLDHDTGEELTDYCKY